MDYTKLKIENREKINQYATALQYGEVDFYPAYIQLEQTNRCNAECIMCNHFYLGNRGCGDLSETVIEKIQPILPYCQTIMLNGDGEPFLSRTIEKNINCYALYGIKVGTNTNFCFVPESLWPYFADTFAFLNISCDGATSQTFEMIRRGLKFKQFLANISRLNDVAPNLIKNFDCVVTKQNLRELPDIVRIAGTYGVRSVRFHRLGVNPFIANESDQVEYYYDLLDEMLQLAEKTAHEIGVVISYPKYQRPLKQLDLPLKEDMFREIEKRKVAALDRTRSVTLQDDYYSEKVMDKDLFCRLWNAGKVCQWAIERCYIDINGNVSTCCFNMKKNMGSLMEHTFDEIWNGDEYVAFRKNMAKHLLPDFCRQCNWIKESRF